MYDIAVAKCPRSPNQGNNPNPRTWWDFPNFDLRVNYTGLIGGPDGAMADRVNDSLRVYLGLMKNLDDVFLNTEPVSLFPGTNMLSVANLMLRQRLAAPRLATLGFEVSAPINIHNVFGTEVCTHFVLSDPAEFLGFPSRPDDSQSVHWSRNRPEHIDVGIHTAKCHQRMVDSPGLP